MKITMLTIGTFGDVQPYVALAIGLKEAGYDITLSTHRCFSSFVASYSIHFEPLAGDPDSWADGMELGRLAGSGKSFTKWMTTLRSLAEPLMRDILNSCCLACSGADAIMYSPLAWAGYSIAEKLKIPSLVACLQPMTPTWHLPSVWSPPGIKLGGIWNRLTHVGIEQIYWYVNKPFINRWRKDSLDLPPLPPAGPFKNKAWQSQPFLYGFSPLVVPPPSDWPKTAHVTGYWFLPDDSSWHPDNRLSAFLEEGPPPVFIGFGSMPDGNPEELEEIVLEALRLSGRRAVVQGKWVRKNKLTDNILSVDWVPHSWLFKKCSAIVHHGGASTIASSLYAGVPTVVVPYAWDQFFWGERVRSLGVGPEPVSRNGLTVLKLHQAIETAEFSDVIKTRATGLGLLMRNEHGIKNAAGIVNGYLASSAR